MRRGSPSLSPLALLLCACARPAGPVRHPASEPPATAAVDASAHDAAADAPVTPDATPTVTERVAPSPVVQLALGHRRACAARADGRVVCWGRGVDVGQGDPIAAPTLVRGLSDAVQVVGDTGSWCARTRAGAVRCWDETLRAGSTVAEGVEELSEHCARSAEGAITCAEGAGWTPRVTPPGLGSARGMGRGPLPCALLVDGAVWCWGGQRFHYVPGPSGAEVQNTPPVRLPGLEGATELWTSDFFSACALRRGEVLCWGGEHSQSFRPRPVQGLRGATRVVVAEYHACALLPAGRVACWGANVSGQLGRPVERAEESARPVLLEGLPPIVEVAVGGGEPAGGGGSTCARTREGAVHCFGQIANDTPAGPVDLASAQEPP